VFAVSVASSGWVRKKPRDKDAEKLFSAGRVGMRKLRSASREVL
jgi:hypothetical protein